MRSLVAPALLHGAKTFAAAVLALYVAFSLDLDRPYWAMGSVFIASQTFAGGLRAKALYRAIGTVIGGVVSVILVPPLVDSPELLTLALASWCGLCLFISLQDRTPRSYAFMLAGYTAAFIAFPSVAAPDQIFTTALARVEEILLGVTCAWLVGALVFPRHAAPLVARDTTALRERIGAQIARVLRGADAAEIFASRREIVTLANALEATMGQAAFEFAHPAQILRGFSGLLGHSYHFATLLNGLVSRLAALDRAAPGRAAALQPLLEQTASLFDPGSPHDTDDLARRLASHEDAPQDWPSLLEASIVRRLRETVSLWARYLALAAPIERGDLSHLADVEPALIAHRDIPMAFVSGFSAFAAVGLGCAFWIATQWQAGAAIPMLGAVGTSFFATRDDPAPSIVAFMLFGVVGSLIGMVYLFVFLPAIDGFPLLVCALAICFLPLTVAAGIPKLAPVASGILVLGSTGLGLTNTFTADFASFMDSSIAQIVGLGSAAIVTMLIRSVGAEWQLQRLVAGARAELAQLSRSQAAEAHAADTLIARAEPAAARLDADDPAPFLAVLAYARAGVNLVDLRHCVGELGRDAARLVTRAIHAVERFAIGELDRPGLGARLDDALRATIADPEGRAASDALVGLHVALLGDVAANLHSPPPAMLKAAA